MLWSDDGELMYEKGPLGVICVENLDLPISNNGKIGYLIYENGRKETFSYYF